MRCSRGGQSTSRDGNFRGPPTPCENVSISHFDYLRIKAHVFTNHNHFELVRKKNKINDSFTLTNHLMLRHILKYSLFHSIKLLERRQNQLIMK